MTKDASYEEIFGEQRPLQETRSLPAKTQESEDLYPLLDLAHFAFMKRMSFEELQVISRLAYVSPSSARTSLVPAEYWRCFGSQPTGFKIDTSPFIDLLPGVDERDEISLCEISKKIPPGTEAQAMVEWELSSTGFQDRATHLIDAAYLLLSRRGREMDLRINQNLLASIDYSSFERSLIALSRKETQPATMSRSAFHEAVARQKIFKFTTRVRAAMEIIARKTAGSSRLPVIGSMIGVERILYACEYPDLCVLLMERSENARTYETHEQRADPSSRLHLLLANDFFRRLPYQFEKADWFPTYVKNKFGSPSPLDELLNIIDESPRCWYTNSSPRNYLTQGKRIDLDSVYWMPADIDVVTLFDDPCYESGTLDKMLRIEATLRTGRLTPAQAQDMQQAYLQNRDVDESLFEEISSQMRKRIFCTQLMRHYSIILDRLREIPALEEDDPHKEYVRRVVPARVERLRDLAQGTRYENIISQELKRLEL